MHKIFENVLLILTLLFAFSHSKPASVKVSSSPEENAICRKLSESSEHLCVPKGTCWYYNKKQSPQEMPLYCGILTKYSKICCPPVPNIVEKKCDEYTKFRDDFNACSPNGIPAIIGGTRAYPQEFPHLVRIAYMELNDGGQNTTRFNWLCGGSLISENFVLTAAHCNAWSKKKLLPNVVVLAANDIKNYTKPTIFKITEHHFHKNFNSNGSLSNDIALFKLNSSIQFDKHVIPICLSTPKTVFLRSEEVTISGWGRHLPTDDNSSSDDGSLQKTTMKVQENAICINSSEKNQNKPGYRSYNPSSMICMKSLYSESNSNACVGDSGGAVQYKLAVCRWIQCGIISFGSYSCRINEGPLIATSVSSYNEWIQKIVWPLN